MQKLTCAQWLLVEHVLMCLTPEGTLNEAAAGGTAERQMPMDCPRDLLSDPPMLVFLVWLWVALCISFQSEVSKRGWRTEGVGARKSFLCQRFRFFFCTPFSYALLGEGGHISGELFGLFLGVCLSPTPSRQPLFETSDSIACKLRSRQRRMDLQGALANCCDL